ncbi:MAG: ATP-binding protein [Ruminococcus sp.]|nr:ATP-binding protein [Ruminococcus sp.]
MNITRGKIQSAKKVVIYGAEGIGKSTFAARFPEPLFIDTEGSTKELDVARFDKPTSWAMLLGQIDYVIANKPCKTLVIDTVDWAEALCLESVCAAHGKKGIEDFGYGNGYMYEKEEFGRFLNKLTDVINAGVNVVLTAHAIIRKFEQPDEMGSYDRWELKLGKKTTNLISPLVKEWADIVLFANYKTLSVAADKDGKKHKAQGGKRVMYTAHHPCWDAKNRYGLPEELPFEYAQISAVIEGNSAPIRASASVPEELPETLPENPAPATPPTAPSGIPKALADLMTAGNVTEKAIQAVVAEKGYFPIDMPIADYPEDFINGVLIGAWEQVHEAIIRNEYPF